MPGSVRWGTRWVFWMLGHELRQLPGGVRAGEVGGRRGRGHALRGAALRGSLVALRECRWRSLYGRTVRPCRGRSSRRYSTGSPAAA